MGNEPNGLGPGVLEKWVPASRMASAATARPCGWRAPARGKLTTYGPNSIALKLEQDGTALH